MAKTMVSCVCQNCSKQFEVEQVKLRFGRGKYCSPECYHIFRKQHPEANTAKPPIKPRPACIVCGNPTKRLKSRTCSPECFYKSQLGVPRPQTYKRIKKLCPQCKMWFSTGGRIGHPEQKYCGSACQGLAIRKSIEHGFQTNPQAMMNNTNWQDRRLEVLERDHHECVFCASSRNLQVHHIIPRDHGGDHEMTNLFSCCRWCHGSIDRVIDIAVVNNPTFNIGAFTKSIMRKD